MKKKPRSRIFGFFFGMDKQGRETEFIIKGRTKISTKTLITLGSVILGTGLLAFAQLSDFGRLILESLRRFVNF
jgi:hypothetical protein